jgi:threonine synthase
MQAEPSDPGIWRFAHHLPMVDTGARVTLGEGNTPLLAAAGPTLSSLPLASLRFKTEQQNPTGSFKDRIAAVAASLIRQNGLGGAVGTSSGNGGAAMAAYGARHDLHRRVLRKEPR